MNSTVPLGTSVSAGRRGRLDAVAAPSTGAILPIIKSVEMRLAVAIFLSLWTTVVSANAGCGTKEALDALTDAAISSDYRKIRLLMATVCREVQTSEYTIVKRGFRKSRIRLRDGTLLWITNLGNCR